MQIILSCTRNETMLYLKKQIAEKFEFTDMGKLHHFLGVKIVQRNYTIWIGQPH